MFNSQQDFDSFMERYSSDIKRIDQMLLNVHSVANLRYIYSHLENMPPEITHEFFMRTDALTTGLVVGYGRLFTQGNGTTKLNRNIVPHELRHIHDEIMSLRNERYAHHGEHKSISTNLEFQFDGTCIAVNPQLVLGYWVGVSKEWRPLFEWIDSFMYDTLKSQLDYLSKKSGVRWSLRACTPPPWIDRAKKEEPADN